MVHKLGFRMNLKFKFLLSACFTSLWIFLFAQTASAQVMFEGYYRIKLSDATVGYTLQKVEFDKKKKQFISTYFLKTNPTGGDITESLKAVSNEKFQPISYQYTNKTGQTVKTIDASFNKELMSLKISDGTKVVTQTRKVPKGTFLSSVLAYVMLQNGYKVGKKFTYSAVAEEDGESFSGEAFIKEEQDYIGHGAFRILNKFKGSNFVSFVTPQGEILGTSSPIQQLSTELVASPAEATVGFVLPNQVLASLFGSVPKGVTNAISKKQGGGAATQKAEAAPSAESSPKTAPVNKLESEPEKVQSKDEKPPVSASPKKGP